MSDDEFDEESFAAYENELYGDKSDSDNDIESEVEDALYSHVHYSFSLPDEEDHEHDKDDSESGSSVHMNEIVESGKHAVITISDDDDNDIDDDDNRNKAIVYVSDSDSSNRGLHYDTNDGKKETDKDSHNTTKENWDLIDKDIEDETKGVKRTPSRYYAPGSKNPHIRCHNCNEKGHLAKDCSVPKKISCVLCGTPGHIRVRCPNQLCFNCSQPGHRSYECQQFRVRWTDQCRRCFQSGHHSNACPDIWRQYHRTTVDGVPPIPAEKPKDSTRPMYCYNCSAKGHYGHECLEERSVDRACSTFQYIVRYDGHHHYHNERTRRNDIRKRQHDREREQYTTPKHCQNERTAQSNNRKRQYNRERDDAEYTTPKQRKKDNKQDREHRDSLDRRRSWPSKKRAQDGEYSEFKAGRVKDGSVVKQSGPLDLVIDDVPIPEKSSKKKKKNKKKKLLESSEPSSIDVKKAARKEKQLRRKNKQKNKALRTVEYFDDQSNNDEVLTRTVELSDSRERMQSDTLLRIVDDWEEMKEKKEKGNLNRKSNITQKKQGLLPTPSNIKHKNQGLLPNPLAKDRFSSPGFSNYEQMLVTVPSYKESLPAPHFRGRGVGSTPHPKQNFLVDRQFQKWPKNNKTNNSGRGFRSKKKNRTL